jgi:hypothetical protein
MVDDIVGEEGNRQEDKHPGQDGYQDKCEVRVPLNPDKRSCAAGRVVVLVMYIRSMVAFFLRVAGRSATFFKRKACRSRPFSYLVFIR